MPWSSLNSVLGEISCTTLSGTITMLCCERNVLEVAMLSLCEVRGERLEQLVVTHMEAGGSNLVSFTEHLREVNRTHTSGNYHCG